VAALRALVPGLAGMSGLSAGRFTVANLVGGSLWATSVAVAGYLAGASYRALESRLGLASDILLAVVIIGVVVVVRARRRSS
jgi:undecaprenyl-diphosphatase